MSPFKEVQSELLSRTSPTIYDVLIAFFGGLVGVIALTRVEKGNPIPGVAIATALMPPLCTAGYGLAIGNLAYFFGAFYLYSINCFFICIATFLIIKYLKYQPVRHLNEKSEKQIRYGISVLIVLMIVPSFYLAYTLFQEKTFNQKVEKFITNEFSSLGYTLIYKDIKYNTSPKKVELAFLTKQFTPEELEVLNLKLGQYEITNTELKIRQETHDLKHEILNELGWQNKVMSDKDIVINNLQKELKQYKLDNTEVLKEIAILFPELKDVSLGKLLTPVGQDSVKTTLVMLYQSDKAKVDIEKIHKWLSQKLKTKDIKIVKQ